MKRLLLIAMLLPATFDLGAQTRQTTAPAKIPKAAAQTSGADASSVENRVEAFLRKLYAWGPAFRVKVGPVKDALVPGLSEVSVAVTYGGQSDTAVVYVSKDGRYLLRGDLQDMTSDPLAAVRSRIQLANSPSKGPANARVTVVEYADFQCPTCRQLHQTLRDLVPNYPQVRFVFKDFPLTQIHPWAMTAATAARCAFQQNPDSFWKLHNSIFDNQESITQENARPRMLDYASSSGLDVEKVRACMDSPETTKAVIESVHEGQALKVANTPTVFVNGRRLIGADRGLLEQYIQYELAANVPAAPPKPLIPR